MKPMAKQRRDKIKKRPVPPDSHRDENRAEAALPAPRPAKGAAGSVSPRRADWSVSPQRAATVFVLIFLFLLWLWGVRYADFLYVANGYDSLPIPFETSLQEFCDFSQPASVLLTCGRFLVASARLPWVPALTLAALSTALLALCRTLVPPGGRRLWLSFLPGAATVALLTAQILRQGLYLFGYIQLSYLFSFFFGFLFAFVTARAIRRIARPKRRACAVVATVALFYPLFGFFALFTGLLAVLDFETVSAKNSSVEESAADATEQRPLFLTYRLWLLAAILLIPILWYPIFMPRLERASVYTVGLIVSGIKPPNPGLNFQRQLLTALAVLSASLPSLVSFASALRRNRSQRLSRRGGNDSVREESSGQTTRKRMTAGESALLVVLTLFFGSVLFFSPSEDYFFATLKSLRPLEEGNWEELLAIERTTATPIAPLIELRRLALFRTGRAAEEMYDRTNFCFVQPDAVRVMTFRMYGASLLFHHGTLNLAVATAMNGFVDMENRSPYYAKILALCAAADGDKALAEKYLDWLKRRVGCTGWAADAWEALDALEAGETPRSGRPALLAEQIKLARDLKPYKDYVDFNNHVTVTSCYAATWRDTTNWPLELVEMQLLQFMQMADMKRFSEKFPAYYERLQKERPGRPIPKALQQGALMDEFHHTNNLTLNRYPYDPEMVRRFQDFILTTKRSVELSADEFGDTWWLYFVQLSRNYFY